CNRAYQLSQTVGEREKLVPIQWGLWANYFVSGDHPRSLAAARQAHDLAHAIDSPMYQLMSYHALAASLCAHGDFEGSARLIEAGEAVFDPEREQLILAQIQLTSIGRLHAGGVEHRRGPVQVSLARLVDAPRRPHAAGRGARAGRAR